MFGRRKQQDEDPFAALKEGGTYSSEPTTIAPAPPAPIQIPSAPPGPPRLGPPQPRMRTIRVVGSSGWGLRAIVFALPVIIIAAVAIPIISTTSGVIHDFSSFNSTGGGGSSGAGAPSAPVNYMDPANLSTGLAHVAAIAPGAKLYQVRIDASSLNAITLGPDGTVKDITFNQYGTTVDTGAGTGAIPLPLSAINPNVVPKLLRQLQRRFHVPPSQVDYMLAFHFQGLDAAWGIYLKAPSQANYLASLSGRGLGLARNG